MKRSKLIVSTLALAIGAGLVLNWVGGRQATNQVSVTELAKKSSASAEDLPLSTSVLADTDLPPEGTRSLFDHIASQNGGVPYPFTRLVETIQKMNPGNEPPVIVMLPHGRSLLKGQSDDARPRVLLAADSQAPNTPASLGVNARGQLFLGFVENANEIEVLSYNEAAGRFEFQLVQDYSETGARKLVYARRQICLTCHQGGAPIFSVRPWNETNGSSGTVEAIQKARTEMGLDPHSYLGLPTAMPLSAPERFDELTDVGNFFATTQKLWLDGCGTINSSVACRKSMLKLAFQYKASPGDFKEEGNAVETLREYQAKSMGSKTIAVAESDLVNRDPIAEQQGFKNWLRNLTTTKVKFGDGAKNNEDLDAFDKLPKLPKVLDPLTVREPKFVLTAKNVDGAYGLASLFTEDDMRLLLNQAQGNLATLLRAVDQMPDQLFQAHQFERVKVMQALLGSGQLNGNKLSLKYAFTDVSEMSPPIATGEPPLQLAVNSKLHTFEAYCFSCHRGNPSKRLNFMGGSTEDAVLAQIKDTSSIRDALDWTRYEGTDKESSLMPPRDSAQYRKLKEDLKHNPELLKQMQEQVPSLFSF